MVDCVWSARFDTYLGLANSFINFSCVLLTHWGRVTHICVSDITNIGSDNGLPPGRRQAIIRTNAGILLIRPLRTNFSEKLIENHIFPFTKIHLKMSSRKWRPVCLGLIELTVYIHGQVYWDSPITYFIKSSQHDFKMCDSSPSPISNFTKFTWHDFKMGDISDDNQPRRASNIQAHQATSFTLKPHTIELSAWMAEMDGIYVRMLCLFNSIVLGPIPLTVLRSNLKFDKNLECSRLKYAQPITAIVCTCHDSYTVVTCAKFRCDR